MSRVRDLAVQGDHMVVGHDVAAADDEAGAGALGAVNLDRHDARQTLAAMPATELAGRLVSAGGTVPRL